MATSQEAVVLVGPDAEHPAQDTSQLSALVLLRDAIPELCPATLVKTQLPKPSS